MDDDAYGQQERARGAREAILGFLKGRFGAVPEEVSELLREVWKEAPLQKLAVGAGQAESLVAFTGLLRRKAKAERSARQRELSAGVRREAIQAVLWARFGSVPVIANWMIEEIKDRKTLESLRAAASRCHSWEGFWRALRESGTHEPTVRSRGR